MNADFSVSGGGTIYLLTPNTPGAILWIEENIGEHQDWCGAVAVEHRFIDNVVVGILESGLTVERDGDEVLRGDDGELLVRAGVEVAV